eukprot:9613142-Alexandrium_andersonii.AAC.1
MPAIVLKLRSASGVCLARRAQEVKARCKARAEVKKQKMANHGSAMQYIFRCLRDPPAEPLRFLKGDDGTHIADH